MTLNDILVYTGKFGALKAQNKEGQKSEVVKLILLI